MHGIIRMHSLSFQIPIGIFFQRSSQLNDFAQLGKDLSHIFVK